MIYCILEVVRETTTKLGDDSESEDDHEDNEFPEGQFENSYDHAVSAYFIDKISPRWNEC